MSRAMRDVGNRLALVALAAIQNVALLCRATISLQDLALCVGRTAGLIAALQHVAVLGRAARPINALALGVGHAI